MLEASLRNSPRARETTGRTSSTPIIPPMDGAESSLAENSGDFVAARVPAGQIGCADMLRPCRRDTA